MVAIAKKALLVMIVVFKPLLSRTMNDLPWIDTKYLSVAVVILSIICKRKYRGTLALHRWHWVVYQRS